MTPKLFKKIKSTKREQLAWYLYDFGNSAYAAVVLLAIYSAYFKGEVVGGAQGSRLWGISVGIAMLVVAFSSPFLGTIADFAGSKKRFLLSFSMVTWIFTGMLFFVQKGDILMGMVFFILAEIGYRSGQVFYNSLLPEIAEPEEMGRISGMGWAIGSAGGILCLLIILPPIILSEGTLWVRISYLVTAVFFALSALPTFFWITEKAKPQILPAGENYATLALKRLLKTIRSVRRYREFLKFIVAFLIYNDGILMAMDFAAIIGATLYGMDQTQLIIFMIIVQVTSIFGAYLFAQLGERTGYKRSLMFSLILMMVAVFWMMVNPTLEGYFLIGGLAGFALTGVQSVSRTLVGYFAPRGQSAEFFGFFAVAGRTSSFIGPTVYGFVAYEAALWFQSQGWGELIAEQFGQKVAIGSIAIFLLVGMAILYFVNEEKARQAALDISKDVVAPDATTEVAVERQS